MKGFGQLVSGDLAGRVGRLPLQRVALVDGDVAGRAVHLAGRGVDQSLYPGLAGRLQHVERPFDVGAYVGSRRVI